MVLLLLLPKSDLWGLLLLGDLDPLFLEDEDVLVLVLLELPLSFSALSPLPGLEALDFTFFLGRYL